MSAEKLVGTWEVTRAEGGSVPVGATMTSFRDGKAKMTLTKDGNPNPPEGTYSATGDPLTLIRGSGGSVKNKPYKIKTLNDTSLGLQDEKGKRIEFTQKK